MNFREHFEKWHKAKYGYVGKHTGTAMYITYQTTACQQRWEAWQACADWHSEREILNPGEDANSTHTNDRAALGER